MAQRYSGGNAKTPLIESIIRQYLGVDADYEPQYDRLKLHSDARLQSRLDKNRAPKHMVERYAHQMGESEFPPIVITSDGVKIDGNTRDAAHAKRNDRYIPALIVPIAFETAEESVKRQMLLCSQAINNTNGLALDDEERTLMAYTMIEDGNADEEIITRVGVPINKVKELRERFKATHRLLQVGIKPDDMPPKATLRTFGKPVVQKLDDAWFKSLADLSKDAGLKSQEIGALATTLGEISSEDLRRERMARERTARQDQITANREGQRAPRLAGKLRQRLALLFQYPVSSFVENDPEMLDEHLDLIDKTRDVLDELYNLQVAVKDPGDIADQAADQAEARIQ